jgi:RNA polymerase sigma factor (sigma-70 family)
MAVALPREFTSIEGQTMPICRRARLTRTHVPVFFEKRVCIERFRAGDRAALAEVYRYYCEDVYRLARRGFITRKGARAAGMRHEADRLDFVQDVFVKAFATSARTSYDGSRPYRPFLLQIARNLRVDQLRQSGRVLNEVELASDAHAARDFHDTPKAGAEPPDLESTEVDLHWSRLLNEAVSFLGSLRGDVQTVAQLRFVEELSQVDVAERLGITRRRVRTLEGRLLGSVRRHLSRSGLTPA